VARQCVFVEIAVCLQADDFAERKSWAEVCMEWTVGSSFNSCHSQYFVFLCSLFISPNHRISNNEKKSSIFFFRI